MITTLLGWLLLGSQLNLTVFTGAICAILGVLNYNYDATPNTMTARSGGGSKSMKEATSSANKANGDGRSNVV